MEVFVAREPAVDRLSEEIRRAVVAALTPHAVPPAAVSVSMVDLIDD